MDAFWNEYHFWMLAESVSQSLFYRAFNAVSDPCFKRKCLMDNGEIILHLKRIYIMHQASFWRARNIAHENDYAAVILIGMTLNFTFSWMRGNWYVLQTAQGHHCSWFLKKISRVLCFCSVVHTCTKSLNKTLKLCSRISNSFSP